MSEKPSVNPYGKTKRELEDERIKELQARHPERKYLSVDMGNDGVLVKNIPPKYTPEYDEWLNRMRNVILSGAIVDAMGQVITEFGYLREFASRDKFPSFSETDLRNILYQIEQVIETQYECIYLPLKQRRLDDDFINS